LDRAIDCALWALVWRKVTLLNPSMPSAIKVSKTNNDRVITRVNPLGSFSRDQGPIKAISRGLISVWFIMVLSLPSCSSQHQPSIKKIIRCERKSWEKDEAPKKM
jgi:hypothetical protein